MTSPATMDHNLAAIIALDEAAAELRAVLEDETRTDEHEDAEQRLTELSTVRSGFVARATAR